MATRVVVLGSVLALASLAVPLGGCGAGGEAPRSLLDVDELTGDGGVAGDSTAAGLIAQIDVSRRAGVAPLRITFDARGSGGGRADIVQYDWDFGDGETGSGVSVHHTYGAPGVYTAALDVVDSSDDYAQNTLDIYAFPAFEIAAEPTGDPLTYRLTAHSMEEPALPAVDFEFVWDFGDGETATGHSVIHAFQNSGIHTVTLSIALAMATFECTTARVEPVAGTLTSLLIADAGPDQEAYEGQRVALDGAGSRSGSNVGLIYRWEQVSGPAVELDDPTAVRATFVAPDVGSDQELEFRLTVSDGTQSESDTAVVQVHPLENIRPVADAGSDLEVVDDDRDGWVDVRLSGERSHDPDGRIAHYRWTEGANVLAEGSQAAATVRLSVGGHTLVLTVTDDGNEIGTDEVKVLAFAGAALSVTPVGHFVTSGPAGGPFQPGSMRYELENNGGQPLDWIIAQHQQGSYQPLKFDAWVEASKTSGRLEPGQRDEVVLALTQSANFLTPNTYVQPFVFANMSNGHGSAPRELRLTVLTPEGVLDVTPEDGLQSEGYRGGPFAPIQVTYRLSNVGGEPIDWELQHAENWVSAAPSSGTLAPGAAQNVFVEINANAAALPAGEHEDELRFENRTNGRGNAERPITLRVDPRLGLLTVEPADGLSSAGFVGGPFAPAQKTYTLRNTGEQALDWAAAKSAAWVSLSQGSGALAPGASANVTVSIGAAANGLGVGEYLDTVRFTNQTSGLGNADRNVALSVVAPPGDLEVDPAGKLESTGHAGGPFAPTQQVYTLRNTGGQPVQWTAAKKQSWVTLSKAGGTLGPGATDVVTVALNAGVNALGVGDHDDTVTFTNVTNGSGNTSRGVTVHVTPIPAALEVAPAGGFASSGTQGGPFSPASKLYTLRNAGGEPLSWSAARTQAWIALSQASGTLAPGASEDLTVSINGFAAVLSVGVYNDTVRLTNLTNGAGNTTRGVTLTVSAPPGVLEVTPADGLAGTGPAGGPFAPANKVYTLRNTGGQALNWTAAKTQAWVTLSKTGGSLGVGVSDVVTVAINNNANALGVGHYDDAINFTNTTSHAGDTLRAVALDVTSGPPTISGYVRDETNAPVAGVALTADNGGGSDVTGVDGFYTLTLPSNWSGAVTLESAGLRFLPAGRRYANVIESLVDEDYTARAASPLGINLAEVSYYDANLQFKNLFAYNTGWDVVNQSYQNTGEAPLVDSDGWPTALAPDRWLRTYVKLHSEHPYAKAAFPAGDYVLLFDGSPASQIELIWGCTNLRQPDPNICRYEFTVPADHGALCLVIKSLPAAMRNIRILEAQYEIEYEQDPWQPGFRDFMGEFGVARFMDWMRTNARKTFNEGRVVSSSPTTITLAANASSQDDYYNGMIVMAETGWQRRMIKDYDGNSKVATVGESWKSNPNVDSYYWVQDSYVHDWDERTTGTHARQNLESGASVELMVRLCNDLGVNPWFCMPVAADDEYVQRFAEYVHDHLDPGLTVYLEYANECWNSGFFAYNYTVALGGEYGIGGWGFTSHRSVEMFKIWNRVFNESDLRADRPQSRIVRILPTQAAWVDGPGVTIMEYDGSGLKPGIQNPIASGHKAADYADALSPAFYFDVTLPTLDAVDVTATTVRLPNVANATNDRYVGWRVKVDGQERAIVDYDGATRTLTIDPPFHPVPSNRGTSVFIDWTTENFDEVINACDDHVAIKTSSDPSAASAAWIYNNVMQARARGLDVVIYEGGQHITSNDVSTRYQWGFVQSATANTLTFPQGSWANSDLSGWWITISAGTGADQTRKIVAYNTGTRTATVNPWDVVPDAQSRFVVQIAKHWLKDQANRHSRMKETYRRVLQAWKSIGLDPEGRGAKTFCFFNSTARWDCYGSWGIREYHDQPIDDCPKWQALREFAETNVPWWQRIGLP